MSTNNSGLPTEIVNDINNGNVIVMGLNTPSTYIERVFDPYSVNLEEMVNLYYQTKITYVTKTTPSGTKKTSVLESKALGEVSTIGNQIQNLLLTLIRDGYSYKGNIPLRDSLKSFSRTTLVNVRSIEAPVMQPASEPDMMTAAFNPVEENTAPKATEVQYMSTRSPKKKKRRKSSVADEVNQTLSPTI